MTEIEFLQFLQQAGITGSVAKVLQEEYVSYNRSNNKKTSETLVDLFEEETIDEGNTSSETILGLFDEEVSKEVPSNSESSLQRYEDQGQLGEGGMGEVRRVRDPELLRSIAMKIAHPKLSTSRGTLATKRVFE